MEPSPASPTRPPRLVTLGDLTLDIVVAPLSAIATGSDVDGTILFRLGGSAANAARSFVALGGAAAFVGSVGDDALGRRLVRELRRTGVGSRVSFAGGMETARLVVILGEGGERSFITSRGAADCLAPTDLRRSWFRGAGALHLPAYSLLSEPLASAASLAAEWAHDGGALVSVDLASAEPMRAFGAGAARAAVARVGPDVLFANEAETAALGGRLSDLARTVVIKQGAAGYRVGDVQVPVEQVGAADTTGAGDAFDAGFLFGLLGGEADPVRAARTGHRAAVNMLMSERPELAL